MADIKSPDFTDQGDNQEGFPASIFGYVDDDHDYEVTLQAVVQAGLQQLRKVEMIRNFAGWVIDQTTLDRVEAVPGVYNVGRTTQLEKEKRLNNYFFS